MRPLSLNSPSPLADSLRHRSDHPNVRPNRDGAAPVKRDTVVAPVPVDGTAKAVGGPNSGTLPKVAPIGFAAAFQQANLANCTTATTLDCLKTLYNFGWYRQLATEQNSYGIGESPTSIPPSTS